MIGEIFSIIAPVFACCGIGFVWAKTGKPYPAETVRPLIIYFGTPCLVFANLTTVGLGPQTIGMMAGLAIASVVACAAIAAVILRLSKLSLRSYLPSLMFPNSGNMGLPLALFAFGDEGLALAIAYFLVIAIGQFTVGMGVASGVMSWRALSRSSIIYSVMVAMAFVFSGTMPPAWLVDTTRIIGGLTIPLLLIALGHSLAELPVRGLKRSFSLSVVRLGLGFAVGVGLAEAVGLEGAEYGVLVMQCSMPVAIFSFLFAHQYKTEPGTVAGMVVISTALSFITLPFLLWFVL